ncbi:MAG TPA: hypothetical protein DCY88_23270 [Cyanobacteria bacterium UBA11372]|nr:hypothetical protein [Cyanobacteria bacterium UBA11372]
MASVGDRFWEKDGYPPMMRQIRHWNQHNELPRQFYLGFRETLSFWERIPCTSKSDRLSYRYSVGILATFLGEKCKLLRFSTKT